MTNLIEFLEDNVFEIDSLEELEKQLDIDDLYSSDYLIYSDINLHVILEELQYNGLSDDDIINRIKIDGFGCSLWELYYIKDSEMYILINSII